MSSALVVAAGVILFVSMAIAPAMGQEPNVRVNVGIAAAKPGDPIDIPLTLSGGEDGQVGSVVARIGVPTKTLSYTGMERGLAVELADGDVAVTTSEDPADSTQTVVQFTAKGNNCIRPGILGYVKFDVSTDAQKGDVTLKLLGTDATNCEGGATELAQGDDGQLTIFAIDEQIPVVGCFFFTH